MRQKLINKWSTVMLGLILVSGFLLRCWRLDFPLFDWHSFRQADTVSVTYEFATHDYPIWEPHYQDVSDGQSGQDNPEGYRMVEFPIVNYLLAGILRLLPFFDVVLVSRLASVVASTISVYLIYLLAREMTKISVFREGEKKEIKSEIIGLASSAAMAWMPYAIYYGRTILPEPWQVLMIIAAMVSFIYYLEDKKWWQWLLTLIFLMLSLLVKPTSIFIGVALITMAIAHDGWKAIYNWKLIILAIVAICPLIWWRQFILQYPAGIPESEWLLNGVVYEIDPVWGISNEVQPRWKPLWWRWMFYERLTKMMLGFTGLMFFALGLIPREWSWKRRKCRLTFADWLTYSWWLGCFAYLAVFATGNIRHDYYQFLLVPCVAIIVGRGIYKLWELGCELIAINSEKKLRQKYGKYLLVILESSLIMIAIFFGWRQNGSKFDVNNWAQVRIGLIARETIPAEALIIAHAFDGDTNFLFQTRHRGWPSGIELEDKIEKGASYLVGTDTDDLYHYLDETFVKVYQDDDGFIFDLTRNASGSGIIESAEIDESESILL